MKVLDPVLKSLWLNHTGTWDVRVSTEFYAWVNTANPSLGFEQVGDPLDITGFLQSGKLQGLREEVESFKSGKYGLIKASGLAQEFIERLEGIARTQLGALLPDLLLENDRTKKYQRYVDEAWVDVHLWQLVVKIGDASRGEDGEWMQYDWIYGWLYDPSDTSNTTPRWDGTGRISLGRLRISAFTLLHWLGMTGSEFLGDYQNPAFKYRDEEDEAGVMDFEEDENVLIGNYPLVPVVVEALHHVGVKDAHIHGENDDTSGWPDIPSKVTSTYAYSTIDYMNTAYLGEYIPESFFWKADGDKSLEIWYPGYAATIPTDVYPCFYLTECDSKTSKTRRKVVNLHDINSNIPAGCVTRRMWMDRDTGKLYVMVESYAGTYVVLEVTLGGDYDSIETSSSLLISDLIGFASGYNWHHTQCDMDFGQSRLYAAIFNDAESRVEIGRWALAFTSGAPSGYCGWTRVYTGTTLNGMNIYKDGWGYLGGFRAVRNPINTYHGIGCFLIGISDNSFHIYLYDEEADGLTGYLHEATAGDCFNSEWERFQFFNGHGSIGGFYNEAEDRFYFQFASWKDRQAQWSEWLPGTTPGFGASPEACTADGSPYCGSAGLGYRTFSSHGSNAIEYSTGWCYGASKAKWGGRAQYDAEGAEVEEYEKDYKIALWPTKFYEEVDGHRHVEATTGSIFANKWEYPLLGAPSVTQDTVFGAGDDSIQDRSFVYSKYYKDIEGNSRYRAFLVIHSKTWLPNFSKDFISNGGSLKDEFADICVAYGLIGRFSLWGTYIFPRSKGEIADSVMTITPDWNGCKEQSVPGVNRVKIEYPGGTTVYPTTNDSRNMLNMQSDFVLEDRAYKFAWDLYALHKDNHTQYVIESSYLAMLEPGVDIVQLCLPIPPGGIGFADGETELYELTAGQIGKHTQELVLGRVMKVEVKGVKTTITVISL